MCMCWDLNLMGQGASCSPKYKNNQSDQHVLHGCSTYRMISQPETHAEETDTGIYLASQRRHSASGLLQSPSELLPLPVYMAGFKAAGVWVSC